MTSTQPDEDAAIAADLDGARVAVDAELEPPQEPELDEEGREVAPPPPPEFLSKAEFRRQFIFLHSAPAMMDPDMAPLALPSKDSENLLEMARVEGAEHVADHIYDQCALEDAPKWMKSLIAADGSALQRWGSIGAYLFGMGNAVRQIKAVKEQKAEGAPHDAAA